MGAEVTKLRKSKVNFSFIPFHPNISYFISLVWWQFLLTSAAIPCFPNSFTRCFPFLSTVTVSVVVASRCMLRSFSYFSCSVFCPPFCWFPPFFLALSVVFYFTLKDSEPPRLKKPVHYALFSFQLRVYWPLNYGCVTPSYSVLSI